MCVDVWLLLLKLGNVIRQIWACVTQLLMPSFGMKVSILTGQTSQEEMIPLPLHQSIIDLSFAAKEYHALSMKCMERIRLLLEIGADPGLEVQSASGDTCIAPIHLVAHIMHSLRDRDGQEPEIFTELDDIMKRHSRGSN